MNQQVLSCAEPAGASGRRAGRGRGLLFQLLLQFGAMVGIGALLYPAASDWFAAVGHRAEVSGYLREVEAMPAGEREAEFEIARQYNAFMPRGVLRDPYAPAAGTDEFGTDSAYRAYEQVLSVSGNGVIGELRYPRLGIGLPIYHGTGDDVLSQGVGHLYGSSLPVGGPSTHSVLTSHSGLVRASLFTRLPAARVGDTFDVTVLGETHYYEVDRIETVLPHQTEGLGILPGEDLVTLITCTPTGINSHRLLVRGVRTAAPALSGEQTVVAGDGETAGFPWWAVAFVGASGVVGYLLFAPRRPRADRSAPRQPSGAERAPHQEVPA